MASSESTVLEVRQELVGTVATPVRAGMALREVQVSLLVSGALTVAMAARVVVVETAEPAARAVPVQKMDKMALVEVAVMPATPVTAQKAVTVSMR